MYLPMYSPDHADIPHYIEVLSRLESAIAEAFQPGAFLVEFVPWLRYVPGWLPGTAWQQRVFRWKGQLDTLVEEPYRAAKEAMVSMRLCGLAEPPLG